MAGENAGHTLQPTALVNEAYLRLIEARDASWRDRAHFFSLSARIMRHILVDHARARRAEKRGAQAVKVTLNEGIIPNDRGLDVVALNDALDALAKFDERKGRVVEMRFFGGLSLEEVGAVLKVSTDTVRRDWRLGRAWLQREMRAHPDSRAEP